MTGVGDTGPAALLERRYRRLLWLLPPVERRARGEELVGVLTDVDAGRSWPSPAEAWAVVLMGLRLRAVRCRTLLILTLTALLVAFDTRAAGGLIDMYTGAVLARDMGPVRANLPVDLVVVLAHLAVVVAWLFGAVRVAAATHGTMLLTYGLLIAVSIANEGGRGLPGPQWLLRMLSGPILIMVLLLAAWRYRWAPPRPRLMWLLLVPVCVAAWKGVGAWGRFGVGYTPLTHLLVTTATVTVCAAVAAWLARYHRPVLIVTAGLAGAGAGYLLVGVLQAGSWFWFAPHVGDPAPFALTLLGLGAAAHLLVRRRSGAHAAR
jgi:hypothetical protein